MLPYKQYLLTAVTHHTESYLEDPEVSYDEARCCNGVPVVYEGMVAEADSTEEEKDREEIRHLAPSTIYRWFSWLDKALDVIEMSRGMGGANAFDLTPWLMAGSKQCSPKRRKTLIRAAQALALLKGKSNITDLATARPPP
jgi:hypothetical protein